MALDGPLLSALKPVRGSGWLMALRLALVLASGLAPGLLARALMRSGPALSLVVVEAPRPLPLFQVLDIATSLWPVAAAALASTGLAIALDIGLSAAAIAVLDGRGREASVFATMLSAGREFFWRFAGVSAIAATTWLGLCAAGVLLGKVLIEHGYGAGWTALSLFVVVPGTLAATLQLALAVIGAWVLWVRVLIVVEAPHGLWRRSRLILHQWRRRPWSALGFFVSLTLANQLGSAVVLFAWRQLPPEGFTGLATYTVAWTATTALGVFVWHWTLRAALNLASTPGRIWPRRRDSDTVTTSGKPRGDRAGRLGRDSAELHPLGDKWKRPISQGD